jgi:hypothetical protein
MALVANEWRCYLYDGIATIIRSAVKTILEEGFGQKATQ